MTDLQALRARIDAVDAQLVALYRQRMEISAEIGAYKRDRGLPVRDPAREEALLDRVAALAGAAHATGIRALYREILAQSRARQEEQP